MNLRWYQTYDENGLDSEVELQYYDVEIGRWEPVPFLRERDPDLEDDR